MGPQKSNLHHFIHLAPLTTRVVTIVQILIKVLSGGGQGRRRLGVICGLGGSGGCCLRGAKRVPWILYHDSAVKVMPRGFNDSDAETCCINLFKPHVIVYFQHVTVITLGKHELDLELKTCKKIRKHEEQCPRIKWVPSFYRVTSRVKLNLISETFTPGVNVESFFFFRRNSGLRKTPHSNNWESTYSHRWNSCCQTRNIRPISTLRPQRYLNLSRLVNEV